MDRQQPTSVDAIVGLFDALPRRSISGSRVGAGCPSAPTTSSIRGSNVLVPHPARGATPNLLLKKIADPEVRAVRLADLPATAAGRAGSSWRNLNEHELAWSTPTTRSGIWQHAGHDVHLKVNEPGPTRPTATRPWAKAARGRARGSGCCRSALVAAELGGRQPAGTSSPGVSCRTRPLYALHSPRRPDPGPGQALPSTSSPTGSAASPPAQTPGPPGQPGQSPRDATPQPASPKRGRLARPVSLTTTCTTSPAGPANPP